MPVNSLENYTASAPRIRVFNFTAVNVATHASVSLSVESENDCVTEIRRHADLPGVFVISETQIVFVSGVIRRLQSMRSPCCPHALFILDAGEVVPDLNDLDIFPVKAADVSDLSGKISAYARDKFSYDKRRLALSNPEPLPGQVDVIIVGGGITGLYAAGRLLEKNLSFCLVEKNERLGGIWSHLANVTSQVNTSEGAYRLFTHPSRSNRDHSSTQEMLQDLETLAVKAKKFVFTGSAVQKIEKAGETYKAVIVRDGKKHEVTGRGVILAVNDRVGPPRDITWPNQSQFQGEVVFGYSDGTRHIDWKGKKVVVVGMGAFAVENARTALEAGAEHVTVVCRRYGTVCPKIIDYLNFATPYDDKFEHDNKSNIRNMMHWKKLYKLSGAVEPECWMGKIKHTGHTISVSDIWFVAHHLKKLNTVKGSISALFDKGVVVEGGERIEADIVVNCVGFHRNASQAEALSGYTETYNINYLDRDFMYLADAYIDDNAFNSFFGSSVLEMSKFYMEMFLEFFGRPEYENLIRKEGIKKLSIRDRAWSHYIAGAAALIEAYPQFLDVAKNQIAGRTANFLEVHDLPAYIAENKREWVDIHTRLAGRTLADSEMLPYVFDGLLAKKI